MRPMPSEWRYIRAVLRARGIVLEELDEDSMLDVWEIVKRETDGKPPSLEAFWASLKGR